MTTKPGLNYSKLPAHDQDGMRRYIEDRIAPGGFLTAVITNNLKEAFLRADQLNLAEMRMIVEWFYWVMPSDCWGSEEAMKTWLGVDTLRW